VNYGAIASMRKEEALKRLGDGSISAAAAAMNISYQAVKKWPDPLTDRIADRIEGFLLRRKRERATRKQQKGN
jgi:hypothetical protein